MARLSTPARAPLVPIGIAFVAAAIAPAADAAGWVQEYPMVAQQTSAACKAGQRAECRAGLERLLDLLDGRPDIRCRLSRAAAEGGDVATARAQLETCVRSGLEVKDPAIDPAFERLRGTPALAEIGRIWRGFARPAAGFEPVLALGDPGLVAEDLAHDPMDDSWLVTSVRLRKIVRIGPGVAQRDVWKPDRPDVWGLYALALDRERAVAWVTSSAGAEAPPFTEAERGRSALLKLDARDFSVIARYELEDGTAHGFGDLTLGPAGRPLVADGTGGGVYMAEDSPSPHLRVVVPPGSLRSPQTPARIGESSRFLVPDYSRGIAIVDVDGGFLSWLAHPPELALYGIDGLYLRGRTLVAVQNGTQPERVLVMRLDERCSQVTGWRVAVARVPELGDPTHGEFVGEQFLFLANSGWDRIAEDGTLTSSAADRPAAIWRLKLRPDEAPRTGRCRL